LSYLERALPRRHVFAWLHDRPSQVFQNARD
jgi:hypothetical protein